MTNMREEIRRNSSLTAKDPCLCRKFIALFCSQNIGKCHYGRRDWIGLSIVGNSECIVVGFTDICS